MYLFQRRKLNFFLLDLVLVFFFISCNTLQYKKIQIEKKPEIGTIGIFKNYLFETNYQPKTIALLKTPIRLKVEEIVINKWKIFNEKEEVEKDSILISFEVLDKFNLIQQLNDNKNLLKYLKKAEGYSIVSQTTLNFSKEILNKLNTVDEVYLVQNKQSTLSIELRKDNETMSQIEFSHGKIISFKSLYFCWSINKKRELQIFDLIPDNTKCSKGLYKTSKKAKKKNEFKF